MANHIFARVELHEHADGTKPNYEVLKMNLALRQFSHELQEGSSYFLLPTGEYVSIAPMSLDTALSFVKQAADETGFESCGVISSPEGYRTFGLKVDRTMMPARRVASALRPAGLAPARMPGALLKALKKHPH